jgi:hypothetical protein
MERSAFIVGSRSSCQKFLFFYVSIFPLPMRATYFIYLIVLVLITLIIFGFLHTYTYPIEMDSCGVIYVPSFMKTGTGVQAILRFCLNNLACCNVGVSDGRDLRNTPFRSTVAAR